MKIAIIGGGWVGCHLTYKLQNSHDVTLFEKNENLFQETSFNNQNRLHLGFHYARNSKTRKMCFSTFDKFLLDYGFATKKIKNNFYCVPNFDSSIDYETYYQIFKDHNVSPIKNRFVEVEGCINTNEMYIDFNIMCDFFNNKISFVQKEIKKNELKKMLKQYDIVINCTNNYLKDENLINCFYELTLTLIYKKNKNNFFDSVTFVDGNLFSIYPYKDNLHTVTDVQHTPIKRFKNIKDLKKFKISEELINKKKELIEKKIRKYYPEFNNDFEYVSFFISTKSKFENKSDDRYPVITQNNNLINCFTGKIQGIYIIEEKIKNIIDEKL
jgi:hypothetical protein